MKDWKFVDELLNPLIKECCNDVDFVMPILGDDNSEIKEVVILHKNDRVTRLKTQGKSKLLIAKAVIDGITYKEEAL